MESSQKITANASGNTHVVQCFFCHRVRWLRREHDGPAEWEGLTGFLMHYRVALSSLVVVDTYCDECALFYRQQMTYGRSGQTDTTGTINGPITT